MEKKWLEYKKQETMKKMKMKATNRQHQEELKKISAKDKVWQVQQNMFKERKKMAEVSEKAFNHKKKFNSQKKETENFTIDFGVISHLSRDRRELFIDKLELILNNIILKKNSKNILF